VALPYTLKSILRKKKKYGNSNISLCNLNIPFKKSLLSNELSKHNITTKANNKVART
jgi:hypothetical protein